MSAARSTSLAADVPLAFKVATLSVPVLIGAQLFLVGLAVFSDGMAWDWHRSLGGAIGGAILLVLVATSIRRDLRRHRRMAALLFALYCFQFIWLGLGEALESGAIRALHAANAMVLATLSVLLARSTAARPNS